LDALFHARNGPAKRQVHGDRSSHSLAKSRMSLGRPRFFSFPGTVHLYHRYAGAETWLDPLIVHFFSSGRRPDHAAQASLGKE